MFTIVECGQYYVCDVWVNGNLVSVCAPEVCIVQTKSVSNESINWLLATSENRESIDDIWWHRMTYGNISFDRIIYRFVLSLFCLVYLSCIPSRELTYLTKREKENHRLKMPWPGHRASSFFVRAPAVPLSSLKGCWMDGTGSGGGIYTKILRNFNLTWNTYRIDH